jgi:hypothetical protein
LISNGEYTGLFVRVVWVHADLLTGVVLAIELMAGCVVEERMGVRHVEPLVLWVEVVAGVGGVWPTAAEFPEEHYRWLVARRENGVSG